MQVTVDRPHPLRRPDEDPEPRRVEERDAVEIDHDVVGPLGHDAVQFLTDPWDGGHVDLARHGQHRATLTLVDVEIDLHSGSLLLVDHATPYMSNCHTTVTSPTSSCMVGLASGIAPWPARLLSMQLSRCLCHDPFASRAGSGGGGSSRSTPAATNSDLAWSGGSTSRRSRRTSRRSSTLLTRACLTSGALPCPGETSRRPCTGQDDRRRPLRGLRRRATSHHRRSPRRGAGSKGKEGSGSPTNRSSSSPPPRSLASRRSSAGSVQIASSTPRSSSASPGRRGSSGPSASGCSARPAPTAGAGRQAGAVAPSSPSTSTSPPRSCRRPDSRRWSPRRSPAVPGRRPQDRPQPHRPRVRRPSINGRRSSNSVVDAARGTTSGARWAPTRSPP